ncbi:hypothetical protein AVEN_170283-1 [Araneus ventricosus]|uniref:Transmembrane protein n=1 Tax=Araneus ventricosus TaxID=182803 RepID=A0A4Y2U0W8_ARAVE|nr:hypothetical protein AVEN_170283-1 [Araneus ventricosus]
MTRAIDSAPMTTTHVVFLSLMFSSPLRIIFLPLSFFPGCRRCHLLSGNKRKKNDKNSGAIVNDESTIVDNEADGATILRRKLVGWKMWGGVPSPPPLLFALLFMRVMCCFAHGAVKYENFSA